MHQTWTDRWHLPVNKYPALVVSSWAQSGIRFNKAGYLFFWISPLDSKQCPTNVPQKSQLSDHCSMHWIYTAILILRFHDIETLTVRGFYNS